MGILDDVVKGALGSKFGGSGNGKALVDNIMGLITNPNTGGMNGLIQKFKDKGLSELMDSWISTGQNKPISPDQIQDALGEDKIQEMAGKLNLNPNEVSKGLADFLPQIIDKLTPDGKLPEGDMLSKGISLLKGKLFGS